MRSTMSAARGGFAPRLFALAAALSAVVVIATSTDAHGQTAAGDKQPGAKPADKPADKDKGTDKAGSKPTGDDAQPAPSPGAGGAGAASPAGASPAGDGDAARGTPTTSARPPTGAPSSEVPVNIRLRQLEQRVQALKERAWRAKARVEMLKEAVLGGGIGARAGINHVNRMGNSYRLVQLIYALDGTTIFTRKDDSGAMHDSKSFDILSGPITPGSHTLSVMAIYRGHGYGVFRYLKKYKFTVKSSHTFTVDEGKGLNIRVIGYERGGTTTPLEDRPALDFQVNVAKE